MSIWIWNDVPIYRCENCNGIGFKLEDDLVVKAQSKGHLTSDMECPGCAGRMNVTMLDDWKLNACRGCAWVFATPMKEASDTKDINVNGTRYTAMLNWVGGVYEKITRSLDERSDPKAR